MSGFGVSDYGWPTFDSTLVAQRERTPEPPEPPPKASDDPQVHQVAKFLKLLATGARPVGQLSGTFMLSTNGHRLFRKLLRTDGELHNLKPRQAASYTPSSFLSRVPIAFFYRRLTFFKILDVQIRLLPRAASFEASHPDEDV